MEIRGDGSWGELRVVLAPASGGPGESPVEATTAPSSLAELSALLKAHLAQPPKEGYAGGRQHLDALLSSGAAAAAGETRTRFLGALAHVEAMQGDLSRAARHSAQVLDGATDPLRDLGSTHALMAQAWVALERAEFATARRHLRSLEDVVHGEDEWLVTSYTLAEAKVSIARGNPEEATWRLAVRERTIVRPARATDWLSELVTVVHAEALVASGEPQRAMRLLTPPPQHAVVEAMVTAALARHSLGDVRGALAVLSRAVADLDHAPLALQIEAWLLEARMAEDQRRVERTRLLVDRALRSAAGEQMRRAVMRDWGWLRRTVERDPVLMRKHGAFLASCPGSLGLPGHPLQPAPVTQVALADVEANEFAPALTLRESEVLVLLAQMNSTEEIAAALFVSTNTVKTHLKGIFGKLGVSRRVDAVRRGRALGLC